MPTYTVECRKCRKRKDVFRPLSEHGKWPGCHGQMQQVFKPLQVVQDIAPYQAVAVDIATGKPPRIGSRRQHKEFLRRNGYVEVGNEPLKKPVEHHVQDSSRDIKQAIDKIRSEGRWR